LPLLVNKRILDRICREHNITVPDAEVEAALVEEINGLALSRKQFLDTVLKHYKKNLYEFREDVLRPRLQLTRLVQPGLKVTEDELHKAYDSAFGEKVICRIILWPLSEEKTAIEEHGRLAADEKAF
jgi:hypothetical protein